MTRATAGKGAIRGGASAAPMQASDAFFWYAEAASPTLRPLVAGLFMLDRAPDRRRCRAAIERATRVMPRLRQCVAEAQYGFGLPSWQADAGFDLDYHLREVLLPPPATHAQLLAHIGEVFSAPLDHLRPLWEAHLIGGLADDRAALFMKLHHAVLDGVGSNALFDALSQLRRRDPVSPVPRRRLVASPPAAPLARLLDAGASMAGALGPALSDPAATLRQLRRLASGLGGLAAQVAGAARVPTDERDGSVGRRLATAALPLAPLRALKTSLDCTLNDLVLTLVSGAIGRTRAGLGGPRLTCLVPVNLRRADERTELGNRVGGFTVQLPVAERDPYVRLAAIQAQTRVAKDAGHGVATQRLMQASAIIPAAIFRGVTRQMAGRTQLICSNVPGPTAQRFLAGARIETVFPFAPVMFGAPLAIALVSYGPTLGVGIAADPAAVPVAPHRLAAALEAEMKALIARQSRRR